LLHTAHCTLHTAHCTLHTAHCTLHTGHCTLHTAHWTLDTGHWTLDTGHWTLDTGHWTLHTDWTLTAHRTSRTHLNSIIFGFLRFGVNFERYLRSSANLASFEQSSLFVVVPTPDSFTTLNNVISLGCLGFRRPPLC
jgi:hypothetical protein